ncbi:MAG TPA: MFS transporter [Pirellulaceae bacterium]|nr:MFS transporter [Pirellulaceae bacterium]
MTPLYTRRFLLAQTAQMLFVVASTLLGHYARWIEHLGGSPATVGWIMGGGAVTGLLLRPWLGQWIAAVGCRRAWLFGMAIFGVGTLGNFALADQYWPVLLLRTLIVVGSALVAVASLTFVMRHAAPERRSEAIGALGASGFLGMLIGPLVGDLLLGDGEREPWQFHMLFGVSIAFSAASTLLVWFLPDEPDATARGQVRLSAFVSTVRERWPGAIMLVNAAFGLGMAVPFAFLPSFIDDRQISLPGISPIGFFFTAYAGLGLIARFTGARYQDRLGRERVLFVGIGCMGVGLLAFPFVTADRAWLLILPALVCGVGHALVFPAMTSLNLETFDDRTRGTGSTLSLMTSDLGYIAGTPFLGWLATSVGYDAMHLATATVVLSAGAIYAWRRSVLPSSAAAPATVPAIDLAPAVLPLANASVALAPRGTASFGAVDEFSTLKAAS